MSERLIARIWHTDVDPDRADEYERFASEISLPMFKAQPGCAGVLMLRNGASCQVITLWQSQEAIAALDTSASYRETVERIVAQGFLRGEQRVEVLDAHLLASFDSHD
jgi:heme-degrading monooxygenase HmoA